MARRDPTSRLKSVDLPTLGRPTMARVPTKGVSPGRALRPDSSCIRRFTETLSAAVARTAIIGTRSSHRVFQITIRCTGYAFAIAVSVLRAGGHLGPHASGV